MKGFTTRFTTHFVGRTDTRKRQPKYSLHKATGQARVRINGKSVYLGEYGSEESRRRYDEVVADYLKGTLNVSYRKLTIAQLCVSYVKHARTYYVKKWRVTSEVSAIQVALRPLVKLHGKCIIAEFGPAKLKQVRDLMIQNGIVRKSVNRGIGRIKRRPYVRASVVLSAVELSADVSPNVGLICFARRFH